MLVGSPPSYSPDGSWVAFSARPDDGSHGPDVYAWHVGDAKARAVTDDHASVFSGWLGSAILASAARTAQPADAGRKAVAPPSDADPATVVARSFLVDPATREVTDIRRDGVWRPVVDPTSRLVVFWTGTLAWDDAALAWLPADGRLVADRWQDVLEGTKEPAARRLPADAAGAAISDWEVRFDPAGRRLAAWVADPAMPGTGRLALVAVEDNGTLGAVLFGDAAALPGFSLDVDRIAWSTPPGRNGQGSLVAVYAWRGDAAGQMYSLPDPGNEPVVVVH